MSPWQILDVAHDVTVGGLRRHYAALIKQFRPETHPQDFARIREAYEVVLQHARRREAEAEADADANTDTDPEVEFRREQAGVEALADVESDGGETVSVVVHADSGASAPVAQRENVDGEASSPAEFDLAARFHAFRALAQSAHNTDDEALMPTLRELLRARALASLDDSQGLEFALMRWFIESDTPPLTLLFETGRNFDWHGHIVRLSAWLSPWALRRMETLLSLSRDLVYARHFSGNARLRALHSAARARTPMVFRPGVLEAQHWAHRWSLLCEEGQVPALDAGPAARTRTDLRAFASTDLIAGLLAGLLARPLTVDAWSTGAIVVMTAAVAWAGRRGLQVVAMLPPAHALRTAVRWVMANQLFTGVIAALLAIPAFLFLVEYPVVGFILLAPAIAAGIGVIVIVLWRIALWLELALSMPLLWREAVDRLEFDRFLRSRTTPHAGPPFGTRLAFGSRLKAIREALRLQARELATRERPLRAQPFRLVAIGGRSSGNSGWRYVWYGLWALLIVMRLVTAFGH